MIYTFLLRQIILLLTGQNNTLQPLYNTVCYNTILDKTWFKDGSHKWSFFNIIYTFLFGCLTYTVYAMDPNSNCYKEVVV